MKPSKAAVLELAKWLHESYGCTLQGKANNAGAWETLMSAQKDRYLQVAALMLADPPAVLVKSINRREGVKS